MWMSLINIKCLRQVSRSHVNVINDNVKHHRLLFISYHETIAISIKYLPFFAKLIRTIRRCFLFYINPGSWCRSRIFDITIKIWSEKRDIYLTCPPNLMKKQKKFTNSWDKNDRAKVLHYLKYNHKKYYFCVNKNANSIVIKIIQHVMRAP